MLLTYLRFVRSLSYTTYTKTVYVHDSIVASSNFWCCWKSLVVKRTLRKFKQSLLVLFLSVRHIQQRGDSESSAHSNWKEKNMQICTTQEKWDKNNHQHDNKETAFKKIHETQLYMSNNDKNEHLILQTTKECFSHLRPSFTVKQSISGVERDADMMCFSLLFISPPVNIISGNAQN